MQNLVRGIIEISARNRFIVLALYAILIAVEGGFLLDSEAQLRGAAPR